MRAGNHSLTGNSSNINTPIPQERPIDGRGTKQDRKRSVGCVPRPNAQCAQCDSLRQRIVLSALSGKVSARPGFCISIARARKKTHRNPSSFDGRHRPRIRISLVTRLLTQRYRTQRAKASPSMLGRGRAVGLTNHRALLHPPSPFQSTMQRHNSLPLGRKSQQAETREQDPTCSTSCLMPHTQYLLSSTLPDFRKTVVYGLGRDWPRVIERLHIATD